MTARKRPLALDTFTSSDAADSAPKVTLGLVKAGLLEVIREHSGTDDEIEARYLRRTGHPRFPLVTGQRLRTARAQLVREGLVRDSGAIAFSLLNNRATLWEAVSDD